MLARFSVVLVCCFMSTFAAAQSSPELNVMPLPASYQLGSGQFAVNASFSVSLTGYKEPRLEAGVQRFLHTLSRQTGITIPGAPPPKKATDPTAAEPTVLTIHTDHASKPVQELGEDESYSLEVTESNAQLSAATPLGVLNGLQTFLHLVQVTPTGYAVPALSLKDQPRFPWRGLMVDVSRHFMPLDSLRRTLDGMEAVHLNVFHWHLSDNQGFRIESKKFPKLQALGSDGLFYTQAEVRDFIAYARERGIRVIPEFDMPGHSTAMFAAYPELASAPGPYQIEHGFGVMDPAIDVTKESSYVVLDALFGEMAGLFPDRYFHIGGDEVNGKQWDDNPEIQKFKKAHDLPDNAALQAYFTKRLQKLVSGHGKIMMGWDEILAPDLPKDILIQSWRGQQSLADAAQQGFRGLLSNGYYIDLMQPASQHYAVDPLSGPAATLNAEDTTRILGGEATMWTEYVSPENLDSRIWPRTAAIAERLWSPQEVTDVNSMYRRLKIISSQMEWLGLAHHSSYVHMLERLAGSSDIEALRVFADVVEPVKGYTREETATTPATSFSPLNRLVDAVPPESDAARTFNALVDSLVAATASGGPKDPVVFAELRSHLIRWRDNDAKLQPLLQGSFLLQEDTELSATLSQLGSIGLKALDDLERGEATAEDWKSTQLLTIEEAKKPKSQLLLMIASGVQELVEGKASARP